MPPVFRHLARQPIRRYAPCSPLPFRLLASCMLALLLSLSAAAQLGYFHVENRNGVWWMIDPQDQTTMLAGVDRMLYRGPAASSYFQSVKARYPDESAWDFEALARLKLWRFNMIGPESDPALWNYRVPYVMDLHIAEHSGADWRKDRPLDVFDPAFAKNAQEVADEGCLPRTTDHWLVGYLSDDDIPWSEARSPHASMLAMYLRLPADSPGRQHAIEFLRLRYRDNTRAWALAWGMKRVKTFDRIEAAPASPTAAYRADAAAFLAEVAARYFQICASAIHLADPNHLYLGASISLPAPEAVLMASRIADAVALDLSSPDPRPAVTRAYRLAGKPVWIAAFDLPVPSSSRAAAYASFVRQLAASPAAVGYSWRAWTGNDGLVDDSDQPYAGYVAAVAQSNRNAAAWHAEARP